jgi:hypothetical protein
VYNGKSVFENTCDNCDREDPVKTTRILSRCLPRAVRSAVAISVFSRVRANS